MSSRQPRNRPSAGTTTPGRSTGGSEADRLERAEERLVPRTTRKRAGTVRVRKHVVEEPQEIELALDHDEVDVERLPADRPLEADEQSVSDRGDTTVVLRVEERIQVRKVPWVVEELRIRRRRVTAQRRVSENVRKERVEIDTEGDLELTNNT